MGTLRPRVRPGEMRRRPWIVLSALTTAAVIGLVAIRTGPGKSDAASLLAVGRHVTRRPAPPACAKVAVDPAAATWAQLVSLAAKDPARAVENAMALGRTPEEKTAWETKLMTLWAERRPQEAWDWLKANAARMDDVADSTLPSLVIGLMAAREPDLLIRNVTDALAGHQTLGPLAAQVIAPMSLAALVQSGQTPLAKATLETWAQDPNAPDLGESAYTTVAIGLGATQPVAGGEWLLRFPASPERAVALANVTADWGTRDPAAALSWAQSLDPAAGQTSVTLRTFNDWAERDPAHAAAWLADYLDAPSAPEVGDRLVESLINLSAPLHERTDVARQWAALIRDPGTQASALNRIQSRLKTSP